MVGRTRRRRFSIRTPAPRIIAFARQLKLRMKKACKWLTYKPFENGAYEIRTHDLHTASVALSQLS